MPALPFYKAEFKAHKSLPRKHPAKPNTLGDHLRAKRLELKLLQKDVAKMLGVDETSIVNWEKNHTSAALSFLPKIIGFLGYVPLCILPEDFGKRLVTYRRLIGLSQEKLAGRLGVDPGTLRKWEKGETVQPRLFQRISLLLVEALK